MTILYLSGSLLMFNLGKERLRRVDPVPRQAVGSLQEDRAWIQQQASRTQAPHGVGQ